MRLPCCRLCICVCLPEFVSPHVFIVRHMRSQLALSCIHQPLKFFSFAVCSMSYQKKVNNSSQNLLFTNVNYPFNFISLVSDCETEDKC
jgi:hypothetical protein